MISSVGAGGLIGQGYEPVSKEEFLNDKITDRAKVKTYYCKMKVNEETFKKIKAIDPKATSVRKSFFLRLNKDLPKKEQDISPLKGQILEFRKLEKNEADLENMPDSPLGNFQKLPIELLSKIILEHMPPKARHEIKSVSKAINNIVVQGQEEAKKTALQNLELIRPFISEGFLGEDINFQGRILTRFFFKHDGQIIAVAGQNSDILFRDEQNGKLIPREEKMKLYRELYKNPTLLLFWPCGLSKNPEKGNVEQLHPDQRLPNQLKPEGFIAQVSREMIILANRLFEGSKKLSVPGKNTWDKVLSDVRKFPTEDILKASNNN